jgi:hypothetical protein
MTHLSQIWALYGREWLRRVAAPCVLCPIDPAP